MATATSTAMTSKSDEYITRARMLASPDNKTLDAQPGEVYVTWHSDQNNSSAQMLDAIKVLHNRNPQYVAIADKVPWVDAMWGDPEVDIRTKQIATNIVSEEFVKRAGDKIAHIGDRADSASFHVQSEVNCLATHCPKTVEWYRSLNQPPQVMPGYQFVAMRENDRVQYRLAELRNAAIARGAVVRLSGRSDAYTQELCDRAAYNIGMEITQIAERKSINQYAPLDSRIMVQDQALLKQIAQTTHIMGMTNDVLAQINKQNSSVAPYVSSVFKREIGIVSGKPVNINDCSAHAAMEMADYAFQQQTVIENRAPEVKHTVLTAVAQVLKAVGVSSLFIGTCSLVSGIMHWGGNVAREAGGALRDSRRWGQGMRQSSEMFASRTSWFIRKPFATTAVAALIGGVSIWGSNAIKSNLKAKEEKASQENAKRESPVVMVKDTVPATEAMSVASTVSYSDRIAQERLQQATAVKQL